MAKVYLALYKGRKSGRSPKALAMRFADWVIRKATRGIYSHCEIAVDLGDGVFECYSSSLRDSGVRCKSMSLPSNKWDLVEVPDLMATRNRLQDLWKATKGKPYDLLGTLCVGLGAHSKTINYWTKDKWFCSEWCAEVLGLKQPSSWSPNSLANEIRKM